MSLTVFPQGGSDATIYIEMLDDGGALVTGLAAADVSATYKRPLATETSITLSDLTAETDAHADGGWTETDMAGLYRLDLPDAAIARGENEVIVEVDGPSTAIGRTKINLDPYPSVVQGSVSDVSATTTAFDTDLSSTQNDQYIDAFLLFTSGANAGAVEKITDYDGTAKTVTTNAFPNAPADGDNFVIINR